MENQTFNVSNFKENNTPKWAQKVGDACLVVGVVGGVLSAIPTLPAVLATAAVYMCAAGAIGKGLSKLFGTKTVDE